MSVMDTNGNECTARELDLVYSMGDRCPAIPSLSGVLTPPELIKLARWCVADGTARPSLATARRAFPTLAYRSDEKVQSALDFLRSDDEVSAVLRAN